MNKFKWIPQTVVTSRGTDKKLPAEYYIDDKAVEFKGNWAQTLDFIQNG